MLASGPIPRLPDEQVLVELGYSPAEAAQALDHPAFG
jgi:hypothetical protein